MPPRGRFSPARGRVSPPRGGNFHRGPPAPGHRSPPRGQGRPRNDRGYEQQLTGRQEASPRQERRRSPSPQPSEEGIDDSRRYEGRYADRSPPGEVAPGAGRSYSSDRQGMEQEKATSGDRSSALPVEDVEEDVDMLLWED